MLHDTMSINHQPDNLRNTDFSLVWIFASMQRMVSDGAISNVRVFPLNVFTNINILGIGWQGREDDGTRLQKGRTPDKCRNCYSAQVRLKVWPSVAEYSLNHRTPQVQGLFTPMLPHPSTIFIALWHVFVPAISFSSGGHRHCKLFPNRLPLLYNCRIQCRSERSLSP
jgi:hypothetical protein